MNGYLNKFPLAYIFLLGTAVYGAGFIFADNIAPELKSSLYHAMNDAGEHVPTIWGIIALLAVAFVMMSDTLPYLYKTTQYIGMTLGVLCWLYAFVVYLSECFYITAITVSLVYLAFWIHMYYVYVMKRT